MYFIKGNAQGIFQTNPLTSEILEKIGGLDSLFDPYPWKISLWKDMINLDDELLFVLEHHEILGWLVFKLVSSDSLAHLVKFHVLPSFRNRGLGEKFLGDVISELRRLKYLNFYLEVEKSNSAVSVYKKNGFSVIHEIPHFYGRERNALIMKRYFN